MSSICAFSLHLYITFQIPPDPDFPLTDDALAELQRPDAWLYDPHIRGAQRMLQNQFQEQAGLQCPFELAVNLTYNARSHNFVQIMNLEAEHWVCSSNILSPRGFVEVYDSAQVNSFQKSAHLQQQLRTILKTANFTMSFPSVQRQDGNSDCGLFAIANAYSLCERRDPRTITLDQLHMRNHLVKCFKDRYFTPFPRSSLVLPWS